MNGSDEKNDSQKKYDSLCPECGHAFEAYVDRLIGKGGARETKVECPVCGCGDCSIGHE